MPKTPKPKQERARDTFLKWAKKNGTKDLFHLMYSDDVFVAQRIPQAFVFKWSSKKK